MCRRTHRNCHMGDTRWGRDTPEGPGPTHTTAKENEQKAKSTRYKPLHECRTACCLTEGIGRDRA